MSFDFLSVGARVHQSTVEVVLDRSYILAVKRMLLGTLFAISISLSAQDSQLPSRAILKQPFDVPVEKKIVDMGPSPYYQGAYPPHIRLSCYFFRNFVVKEYDEGQKGAKWLAILPIMTRDPGACTQSHVLSEKVIAGEEWCGYFKGAKENLVFFDACDGTDGGLPFTVYDSRTGKRVFEDTAYDSNMWTQKDTPTPFDRLRVTSTPEGQLLLIYLRVVGTDCDLRTEKASCWDHFKAKVDLKIATPPVCSHYHDISGRYVSAVAYPVEVLLSQEPIIKTIAGPVECWPVD